MSGRDEIRAQVRDMEHPHSAATAPALSLKLGLIGDNIAESKSPLLHRLAGEMDGLTVSYDRLVPRDLHAKFDQVFAQCARSGYRGVNVTYPYKEHAAAMVSIDDRLMYAIGAVNTITFEKDGAHGYNTDYSGFIAAYRRTQGQRPAGRVCLVGAGGVGRAIAFALLELGLDSLWIVDIDRRKADALAAHLQAAAPDLDVNVSETVGVVDLSLDGFVNCTPVGMVGISGTPIPRKHLRDAQWAFDAVYTPVETQFLRDAQSEGLAVITGYELFVYQGVDAWRIFSGREVDVDRLRRRLADASPHTGR